MSPVWVLGMLVSAGFLGLAYGYRMDVRDSREVLARMTLIWERAVAQQPISTQVALIRALKGQIGDERAKKED